jgi:hypothetical protein
MEVVRLKHEPPTGPEFTQTEPEGFEHRRLARVVLANEDCGVPEGELKILDPAEVLDMYSA